jgi:hypothetical protein
MYANTRQVVEQEFGKPPADSTIPVTTTSSSTTPTSAVLQPQNQPPTSTPTRASSTPQPSGTPIGRTTTTANQASTSSQTQLPHALYSPKVLTECPIAVVLIFQSFKQLMHTAMQDFYPLVMDVSD